MSLMMMKVMKGGNKGTRFRGFGGMWYRFDSNMPVRIESHILYFSNDPNVIDSYGTI
jgi:hypothetical protein